MVNFELKLLQASRIKLHKIITSLSEDQLFKIPKGFNNNVIWHIGHCIVSQQRLMYLRSNLSMYISDELNEFFKINSSPATWKKKPDLLEIREAILLTVEKLNEDLKNDIFKTYEPLRSSMGFMINNHLEAFSYTNFHEAEHTGNIQYLIRMNES